MERTIAEGMAQQLMDEVLGGRYHAVGAGAYQTIFSPSADEQLGFERELYDDIDDYHGIRNQPPTDAWGIELGRDDDDPDARHPAFQSPTGIFDNWRQEIDVYYVAPPDLTTPLAFGQVSDYRAVVVRIIRVGPQGGERILAEHRQVIAYVPPL
jgi:hypothetical protein